MQILICVNMASYVNVLCKRKSLELYMNVKIKKQSVLHPFLIILLFVYVVFAFCRVLGVAGNWRTNHSGSLFLHMPPTVPVPQC